MNRYLGIYRRCELYYIREELEKYGLLSLEGRLLPLIKDKCMSQEELGYMMNLDKGRIARAVSLLEEKGLVCRQVNEKTAVRSCYPCRKPEWRWSKTSRKFTGNGTISVTPDSPQRNKLCIRISSNGWRKTPPSIDARTEDV